MADSIKVCRTCNQEKSRADFYAHRSAKDGLRSDCKPCYSAKGAERHATRNSVPPEKRRKAPGSPPVPRTRAPADGICTLADCSRPYYSRNYCTLHYDRWKKFGDALATPARIYRTPAPGQLWCRVCEQYKPYSEMTCVDSALTHGRNTSVCRECNRQKGRLRTLQSRRRQELRARYQMTLEEYDALLASQGGVCAICQRPPQRNHFAVDHDRSCCPNSRTCGECVRGLLCSACNQNVEWWLTHGDNITGYLANYQARRVVA